MKKKVIYGGVLALCGVATVFSAGLCSADNPAIAPVSVTVDSTCALAQSGGGSYSTTLAAGTLDSNIIGSTFSITCNDPNGWRLMAIGFGNSTDGDTDMHTNGSGVIATGTATGGSNPSSWAMKLTPGSGVTIDNGFGEFSEVPSEETRVAYAPGKTSSATVSAKYQVYAAPDQAPGSYTGVVKYLLAHPAEESICGAIMPMQGITDSYISSMTPETQVQMCDERDGKTYWVAKLADGNVWMTQNLDLDITAAGLDSTTSDIGYTNGAYPTSTVSWNSSSSTPPVATLTDASQYNNSNDNTSTASWDAGDWYYDGTSSTSCGSGKTTYEGCTGFSNTGNAHYHVGNMYSWGAATAGTGGAITSGQAEGSICPKGWRLPTGDSSGEFQALASASGGPGTSTVQNWLNAPYYFTRTGYLSYGRSDKLGYAGYYGDYWSSTPYSGGSYAYPLHFSGSSNVYANYVNGRAVGMSVRCVAR